jgi:hypothetical protein
MSGPISRAWTLPALACKVLLAKAPLTSFKPGRLRTFGKTWLVQTLMLASNCMAKPLGWTLRGRVNLIFSVPGLKIFWDRLNRIWVKPPLKTLWAQRSLI